MWSTAIHTDHDGKDCVTLIRRTVVVPTTPNRPGCDPLAASSGPEIEDPEVA